MPIRLALTLLLLLLPPVARAEVAHAPAGNLSVVSAALDAHRHLVGMETGSDSHATLGSQCLLLHCLSMRSVADGVAPPHEPPPPAPPVVLRGVTQWLTEPPCEPPSLLIV